MVQLRFLCLFCRPVKLSDYDSLTFKGYFQKGDVAYKLIVAQAFQTKPSGPFEASGTDTLGSYNRAQGALLPGKT